MGRKLWVFGNEIYIWMAKSKTYAEKIVSIVGIFVGKDFKNGRRSEMAEVKGEVKFELLGRDFRKIGETP